MRGFETCSRVVSADDEITGWQQRVANGREAERKRAQRVSDLRVADSIGPASRTMGERGPEHLGFAVSRARRFPGDAMAIQVAEAMDRLGYAYEYGLGLAQSYPQALAWFRKAAENDNPAAMTIWVGCTGRARGGTG